MKLQTKDFFWKHRKNILIHIVNISEQFFKSGLWTCIDTIKLSTFTLFNN